MAYLGIDGFPSVKLFDNFNFLFYVFGLEKNHIFGFPLLPAPEAMKMQTLIGKREIEGDRKEWGE